MNICSSRRAIEEHIRGTIPCRFVVTYDCEYLEYRFTMCILQDQLGYAGDTCFELISRRVVLPILEGNYSMLRT